MPLGVPPEFNAISFSEDGKSLFGCDIKERPVRIRRAGYHDRGNDYMEGVTLGEFRIRHSASTDHTRWKVAGVRLP